MEINLNSCKEQYDECIAKDVPRPLFNFFDKQIQFNQYPIDKNWCVIFAWVTAIINQFWLQPLQENDLKYLIKMASLYGKKPNGGMWIAEGSTMLVDYYKQTLKSLWVQKHLVNMKTEAKKYLRMWYIIHSWWYIGQNFFNDMQDNGILSGKDYKNQYGHSFCYAMDKDGVIRHIDNYYWHLKYNVVKVENFDNFVNSKNSFNGWYIYYTNNKTMTEQETLLAQARELGITNDPKPDQVKLATIVMIMRAYNLLKKQWENTK